MENTGMTEQQREEQREDTSFVIPLAEESIEIRKRIIESGLVRITKVVTEQQETIDTPLLQDKIDVERIPVNRAVESAPAVRYEGDTMIIPVLEEVIVVEKRLMLKEELHITRRQIETHTPQEVMVRREEAKIECIETNGNFETNEN